MLRPLPAKAKTLLVDLMKIFISTAAWLLALGHVFGQCQDLFISEYVEGWSNNKALEIYNPTNDTIDLSDYRLERYANGATSSEANQKVDLQGTLAPHDVVVAVLDKQDPDGVDFEAPVWDELAELADLWLCPVYEENNMMYFNGDDAVVLRKISTNAVLDIFGKVGEDPGTLGWAEMTQNHTLIRKSTVEEGDTDALDDFLVVDEWEGMMWSNDPLNYTLDQVFSNLGFHACACGSLDLEGCTDANACNFNSVATEDDGSCDYSCLGCTDPEALNWDEAATVDDGSCSYFEASCDFLGDPAWQDLGPGLFAPTQLEHLFGTNVLQEVVFNLPAVIQEPTSGSNFNVLEWSDLVVLGMPPGLEFDSLPSSASAGTQGCLSYSGVPLETGLFTATLTGNLVLSVFGNPYPIGPYSSTFDVEVVVNPNPIPGCTYPLATNFLAFANEDDGSCLFLGCTNPEAVNFQVFATVDDGSCDFTPCDSSCPSDLDGDGVTGTPDLLYFLSSFGFICPN